MPDGIKRAEARVEVLGEEFCVECMVLTTIDPRFFNPSGFLLDPEEFARKLVGKLDKKAHQLASADRPALLFVGLSFGWIPEAVDSALRTFFAKPASRCVSAILIADSFQCFGRLGLSIDLVSTSETNVTVSLDRDANGLEPETLKQLIEDLSQHCRVRVIGPCAAVSLVGHPMRANLHKLSPVLQMFREQKVHLVTQAASDLNMTFVVDEDQADPMVQRLHDLVVRHGEPDPVFGPTWKRLFSSHEPPPDRPSPVESLWWRRRRDQLLEIAREHSPVYVYHRETVRASIEALRGIRSVDRVFYAMKSNNNADVLREVDAAGASFECVSEGEIRRVLQLFPDIDRTRILFTPNFAPRSEYEFGAREGVLMTLDNLYPLRQWPEVFENGELLVRLDLGWGLGHHEKVITGGAGSKFGIPLGELDELERLAADLAVRVVGLHAHSGSGILAPDHWMRVAQVLGDVADRFPHVRTLNIGGGLGL